VYATNKGVASRKTLADKDNEHAGESHALEDWLDETMLQTDTQGKEPRKKQVKRQQVNDEPYTKLRTTSNETTPLHRTPTESTKNTNGSNNYRAATSPFNRHRYQKQHQTRRKEVEPESSIGTTSDPKAYDIDEMLHGVLKDSYDVYPVDSRTTMFGDTDSGIVDEEDRNNYKVEASRRKGDKKSSSGTSSAAKKSAMREYVVNTTHPRKLKSKTEVRQEEEEGEDLDEWLDSVIE